ncbi:MAG: glycosyltransferase family 4 protein [bacterium]|nr:glycosyltransferase family 4 protein [bacterium]
MISLDKGLVGGKVLGDVRQRHRIYGKFIDQLDIIVLTTRGFEIQKLSEKVTAYPTNSLFKIFYFFDVLRIARTLYAKSKYDLVVTQDPHLTGLLGKDLKQKFGSKLLVHFHGDFRFGTIARYVIGAADGIRVMSTGQKEKLVSLGVNPERIRVIATPVDVERFANFQPKAAKSEKKIILAVGRPVSVKGFEVLQKAREMVQKKKGSEAAFWIIGNERISWADKVFGNVSTEEMPEYYYQSYLVALPSYSESFGKVLVEANACGKPVVATATTGAREIVKDGYNGYLVPIGDAEALAEKIIYLLEHEVIAFEMGKNGKKLVREKFTGNTENIVNFWKEIVQ